MGFVWFLFATFSFSKKISLTTRRRLLFALNNCGSKLFLARRYTNAMMNETANRKKCLPTYIFRYLGWCMCACDMQSKLRYVPLKPILIGFWVAYQANKYQISNNTHTHTLAHRNTHLGRGAGIPTDSGKGQIIFIQFHSFSPPTALPLCVSAGKRRVNVTLCAFGWGDMN